MQRGAVRTARGPSPRRWVRVHWVELEASARVATLPADTSAVPFELWLNGWLEGDGAIGDQVTVKTVTGRIVAGELVEENPGYHHTFGRPPLPLKLAGGAACELLQREEMP
ncbi:MAG: 2-amino-4-oxopentanoate thiolase subunit OrtA [Solirubrobacterales bacterium]